MLKSNIPMEMKKRNMTPVQLSEITGMSTRTAYRLWKGDVNITLNTLAMLCQLFNVQFLDDLVKYTPDHGKLA